MTIKNKEYTCENCGNVGVGMDYCPLCGSFCYDEETGILAEDDEEEEIDSDSEDYANEDY
jgi:hypothetical protein